MPRILFAATLLCSGCMTHADRLKEVRTAYFNGDIVTARAKLDEAVKKQPREGDVLRLEQASILLSEGKAKEAEQLLRAVRDRFDYLEQKDLAEGALSLVTDDTRLAYAGEDYEKVLVRLFLSLANLMGDGADASAYALQVGDKQQQIIQAGTAADGKNPKESYQRVAAGAYLQAALREETHTNYDDAARSLQLVCAWAPEFKTGQLELQRVQQGGHSKPGHGVVYVFTLVGRGPYKEERAEIPTQIALLVADRILSATGKHTLPPTIAPIKVPRVVVPFNEVQSVRVIADGRPIGQTETLTDIGRLAVQQNEALLPYTIGRAVARRVVKKAAVFGAKELLKTEKNGIGSIAMDVGGVVWEATESADTRCWGLLPDKVQVLRLELPAGKHQLQLQPVGEQGNIRGPAQPVLVDVPDGRNAYVLASFPSGKLAGQVVVSGKAR